MRTAGASLAENNKAIENLDIRIKFPMEFS